jgi:hypothetical protein
MSASTNQNSQEGVARAHIPVETEIWLSHVYHHVGGGHQQIGARQATTEHGPVKWLVEREEKDDEYLHLSLYFSFCYVVSFKHQGSAIRV